MKVYRDSWHYRLLFWMNESDEKMPTSRCTYWPALVLLLLFLAVAGPTIGLAEWLWNLCKRPLICEPIEYVDRRDSGSQV